MVEDQIRPPCRTRSHCTGEYTIADILVEDQIRPPYRTWSHCTGEYTIADILVEDQIRPPCRTRSHCTGEYTIADILVEDQIRPPLVMVTNDQEGTRTAQTIAELFILRGTNRQRVRCKVSSGTYHFSQIKCIGKIVVRYSNYGERIYCSPLWNEETETQDL